MSVRGRDLGRELMQRANVVDDPKCAALRGNDQIVVMKFDVGYGNVRQIQLKRLPVSAVIERNEDAELCARVKQSFAIGIFAHYARRPVGRNPILAVSQTLPGLAIIIGAINVRLIVAEQITIYGVVGRAFAMRRGFNVKKRKNNRRIGRDE